jgi:hypothetical protein
MAKLIGVEKKTFLLEKLEEQCHLLRKSVADFSSGDLTEAVRMAVAIRVLVHETGSQKPLLKQLDANYLQLVILDEKPKPKENLPPGVKSAVIMSIPVGVQISNKGVFFNPKLTVETYAPSILGSWWTRPSLILPGLGGFSRKEIVLGLADKEGGAHVDINLSRRYRQLIESKQFQVGWNAEGVTPLNLSRYMSAQAAVELLDCLDRNFPKSPPSSLA